MSKGISDSLTANSKEENRGLGCFKKVSEAFGNTNDNATNTINQDVSAAVNQRIPYNQATSAFVSAVMNVMNSRRKFFLTTTTVLTESISGFDSQGLATGFVFNTADQSSIVSAFKVYCTFLYEYFSNMSSKINSIQGLIGQLPGCQVANPPAKRLLQTSPQQGNFIFKKNKINSNFLIKNNKFIGLFISF